MSNEVELIGVVASDFILDHAFYGEDFYSVVVGVKRDSGKVDHIPLLVSERLIDGAKSIIGKYIHVRGEFRSYNKRDEDKNRLKLYVFVNDIETVSTERNVNDVFIEGYLCKTPTYRHTPLGREISDLMVAVNRTYNKSDYIPCICWGRSAYFTRGLNAGDGVRIAGRIQSREYTKNGEIKVAYELSVGLLELS